MKILISACLMGENVKYDGGNNILSPEILEILHKYEVIKICPEVLGGLPIPRIPSEIRDEKVINREEIDVTKEFRLGATKALEMIKGEEILCAILKDGSPSCGSQYIYDGTFTKTKISGMGIAAKMLYDRGIKIFSSNDIKSFVDFVRK